MITYIVRLVGIKPEFTDYVGAYRAQSPLHAILRSRNDCKGLRSCRHKYVFAEIAPFSIPNAR